MSVSVVRELTGPAPMKQAMPPLHPALMGETRPNARSHFDGKKREEFARLLTDGIVPDQRALTRALDQISIYCWRYVHHGEYDDYPAPSLQKQNAKELHRWAARLGPSIKALDSQTLKRVVLNLGMRDAEKCPPYTDPAFDGFIDERLKSGERRLARFTEALEDIIAASKQVKDRQPPWKVSRRGLKAVMTPRLERSLVHAIANVWCEFRQEDLRVSNDQKKSSKFRGVEFLSAVLDQLKAPFPKAANRQLLFEAVRSERNKAGMDPENERETRNSSGGANRRYHRLRRPR